MFATATSGIVADLEMWGGGTLGGIWAPDRHDSPSRTGALAQPVLAPSSTPMLCFGACELMLIPMSPTDSLFLLAESENCQMQVGGLALFSPPEGARASAVRDMFAAAIARDKVADVWRKGARGAGRPLGRGGGTP